MQPSFIAKSAFVLLLAGGVLAQTSSKSAGSKTGTAKRSTRPAAASAGTPGLPAKPTVQSFLKHMFSYQPSLTYDVKDIKFLSGTHIADVAINFHDPKTSGNEDKHLYVMPDHKHAIAGTATEFDATPPKTISGLPTQPAVVEFVKKHFLPNATGLQTDIRNSEIPGIAEVTVAVSGGQSAGRLYITTDGSWVLTGEVIPFGADPFAAARAALAKGNGTAKGPANAAVTIVEFSDLECPVCKAAQPVVDQLLAQEPDVRFVFQNFPLEQIHPWAMRAAKYADCVGRENNAAFWKFVENTYADQPNISPSNVDQKLLDIAAAAGANKDKIKACIDKPDTQARIWASQSLGKEVEVQGTPTLFINGRKVSSVVATGVANLKLLVEGAKRDK